ncbi:hypothetical protein BB559_005433 [Furculomyces boomerangus]|uniref:CBM1 domain-containing protein n=2 Tax=Harpellales TaxID=61421 RepID=A0A2T9Y8N6_9FUNG|nr:hypothetical protein BB559_005433 [Furculomyces boomerangus]PWA01096.1 hypothetical protein BB558_002819 [Smittium angustum]
MIFPLLAVLFVLSLVRSQVCPNPPMTCVNTSQIANCANGSWETVNCGPNSTCMTMNPGMIHCMQIAANGDTTPTPTTHNDMSGMTATTNTNTGSNTGSKSDSPSSSGSVPAPTTTKPSSVARVTLSLFVLAFITLLGFLF